MKCPRCDITLQKGIALDDGYILDMCRTIFRFPSKFPKIIECFKCPKCGQSELKKGTIKDVR